MQNMLNMNGSNGNHGRPGVADSTCPGPLLAGHGTLHHLGYVVASISAVADQFATFMSASWDPEIIHDPIQQVRVTFLHPILGKGPLFELVEPASETSPVTNFLAKYRGGLHHVCYEIDDLESGLREAKRAGLVVASPPAPSVAFGGRRIAWVCSKKLVLMELLERGSKL
jgi:methylmalonyl-CoA/ethylmalonyl-CoA epimerase